MGKQRTAPDATPPAVCASWRNVAVHNQAGTLPQLGNVLVNHQAEIKRVFAKCRDLLRAQHPHL